MMPNNSSSLVTKLLRAHGVVLGKTRMHELAEGVTSINVFGGPVLNPYNNAMHVGGVQRGDHRRRGHAHGARGLLLRHRWGYGKLLEPGPCLLQFPELYGA